MSSPSKMPLIIFLFSLLFVDLSIAGYVLEDDYSVSNFFDMFTFFTSFDPTNGFVDYVDQATAQSAGYISTTASTIYIGADHQNVTSGGRPSVRLTSNNAYNAGSLIILDLEHMPGGICGTWPAFWMVGPDWPSGGEIDIIEGVNLQTANAMTLHTSDGCSITNNGNFTGTMETDNCYIYAEGQTTNAGCSIDSSDSETYGTGFNDIGGGVYATEWTDDSISIWFFPRGSIPSDITAGTPSPSSSWGTPAAQFEGGCDIPNFFQDNQLVFDLTFCGDWAGNVWSSSTCSSLADTCKDYVENNPTAFTDAYWTINSLRTYQYSADTSSSSSSSAVSSSTQAVSTYLPVTTVTSTSSSSSASSSSSTSSPTSTESTSSLSSSTTSSTSTWGKSSYTHTQSSSASPSATGLSLSAGPGSWSPWSSWSPSSSIPGSASATSAIDSGSVSLSLTNTAIGKAVTHASTASDVPSSSVTSDAVSSSKAASFSSAQSATASSLSPSSSSDAASSSGQTTATTFSKQASTTGVISGSTDYTGSASSAASTLIMSIDSSSADGSVSTAVPTSQAEIAAKVQAIAEEWSETEPGEWQDEVNGLEDVVVAAASQAAAVSAALKQNQRRHLLQHKRRFGGNH